MKVSVLRDSIGWFGNHTGYEQLTRHFQADVSLQIIEPRRGHFARYAGSAYARLHGNPGQGGTSLSELELRLQRHWTKPDVTHILYLEHHLPLLEAWQAVPKDIVASIHLPPSTWTPERIAQLQRLNSAIILYQRDLPFFEKHVGRDRVRFIPHGADTAFFQPAPRSSDKPRILYAGVYLRNEDMLVRLVPRLLEQFPNLEFDLLVPVHHRQRSSLRPLLEHPAVTWHAGLSDLQLLALYQQSYLLMLPMDESGANTAIVESLTCGLPVVTTDVGGIRDYGGGTVFPVVANNDDDAMCDLVADYLSQPAYRDEIGRACRHFAETMLAWPLIAQKHLEVYQELLQ